MVCESGMTAGGAGRQLSKAGFKQVYVLSGGMAQWRADNLPVTKNADLRPAPTHYLKRNQTKWLTKSTTRKCNRRFPHPSVSTKDVLQKPNTPHIFQKEWQPDVKLDMDTRTNVWPNSGVYEVVLTLTVTCKAGNRDRLPMRSAANRHLHHRQPAGAATGPLPGGLLPEHPVPVCPRRCPTW